MLARNLRSGPGEIDLIVRVDGLVAAVEVKTRIGDDPAAQITIGKEQRMRRAADALRPRPDRIDLVTVRFGAGGATIRWIRGVL